MSENVLSLHFVSEVSEPVAEHIKVRRINLMDVSCKHHFCSFTCSCNNGFYFVGSKVLSFIDDKKYFRQASSPDICKWCNYQLVMFLHLFDNIKFFALLRKPVFYHPQIIEKWLHIRTNFFVYVT